MKLRFPRVPPDSGLRRRSASLLLALAIELLAILMLLLLIPPMPGNERPGRTTTFSVDGSEEDAPNETKVEKADKQAATKPRPVTPQPPVTPPPVPVPPTPMGPPNFIVMTKPEYRAALDALNAPRAAAPAAASEGASNAPDSRLAGGRGPGGEPLYAAEWYRRPRQIELDPYLPRRAARDGYGVIACRTVARYHVDDCQILGEGPAGSGYGYAVLQASFQFLVRPPRVGGKEMVGTWVSIQITYTQAAK